MQVVRVQLVDQVVEGIRSLISRGEIARGDRLPSEVALSEEFGVGRSTVREALRVLGHLGLIETRPGSGSYVSGEVRPDTSIDRPSRESLFELFEFGLALETEIVQLAAERRTTPQLSQILSAAELLHQAASLNDPERMSLADSTLHHSIAVASNNRYLFSVYDQYQFEFAEASKQLIGMQDASHIGNVHDELVEAITVKNVRAASAAVRRTFDEIWTRLKLLESSDGSSLMSATGSMSHLGD
jgi:GntR family transcriptional repressor for pyruvate dehydrogenase complex